MNDWSMSNGSQGESPSLFGNITQDTNIDLSQFVSHPPMTNKPTVETTTSMGSNTSAINNTVNQIVSTNPLEAELNRQRNEQKGLSITREEYEAGQERKEFRSPAMSDRRLDDMAKAETESEFLMKQRAAVIPNMQFTTDTEYIQMVHEISRVRFDEESGKAYFDYEKDDNGNIIPITMVRLRTENDPPYSKENDFVQMKRDSANRERIANGQTPIVGEASSTVVESDDVSNTNEKKNTVQFIIDKTGMGADFVLTPEERQKVIEANEIRLTQVEVLDIASITCEKPEPESFTGKIHEYSLSGSRTTISFPASGFKADISALTYGELADASLSMDSVTVDKYYKRLAIIYNKMKNISSGPFDSFEEFLKNLAYTDIPLAMYGLYVSTFPEVQSITLRCGRQTCDKTFDWNFGTRSVLKLEDSDEVLLNHMAELAAADPNEYESIYKKAPVRNIKYIRLPKCGFIVGLGIASAYEFLYNFIPMLDEKTFRDAFGDDLNSVYMNNILLLTTVLNVMVPNRDKPGTYIKCEGYKNILDAIYNISPEEIKILVAISSKIQKEYQVHFSFGDVTCPHCQNVTSDMTVSMDDLVFQTYQRLLSTEIDSTNIQGI